MENVCYCFSVKQYCTSRQQRGKGGGYAHHQPNLKIFPLSAHLLYPPLSSHISLSIMTRAFWEQSSEKKKRSNRDMIADPEVEKWLLAPRNRPQSDSKSRICKLPTNPLSSFQSLICCWESITPDPIWRVSLAQLCMVWKPACLLRFGVLGVKTPTLCVCACVCFYFYQ